jgi:hypothetical protein
MQDGSRPATDRPPRLLNPGRFALPPRRAAAKLRNGTPLLHDEPVVLDLDFASDCFARLAGPLPAGAALLEAATRGRLELGRVFEEAFVQHPDHLAELAAFAGVDGALLAELADRAVAPLRRAYADALRPIVERDAELWQRSYCPVCGALPELVEAARLRCGACGTTWLSWAGPDGTTFRLELGVPDAEGWDGAP